MYLVIVKHRKLNKVLQTTYLLEGKNSIAGYIPITGKELFLDNKFWS